MTEPPGRGTRRRAQTRQRLLDAALAVVADAGLARTSVEAVCERAGYTRGAFYSNFATLDEVVSALFAQQADALLAEVGARLAEPDGTGPGSAGGPADLAALVARVLDVLPRERTWQLVRTEFTAQALRDPAAAAALAAHRAALQARLAVLLTAGAERAGRRLGVPAPEAAQAVVAVHDGFSTPALLAGPEDAATVRRLETDALTGVLLALSSPLDGAAGSDR
ncbi:TetR/AcrR family transcriptional regulator [Kineococcus terrestris]|uniref:TetR/AcrR family transcriptional regulator n=1 Tax=Kineococcus terrestris TaxID=2044856 RepID=UPI0034DB54D1